MPRARQARSPRERPRARVCPRSPPAILACCASKTTISFAGAITASHASPAAIPNPTSLPCASATFTALTTAFSSKSNCRVNISAPGSSCRTARRTEASSTILFTPRRLAALRDQFVHQRLSRRHVSPHQFLGLGQSLPQRGDSQFVVFNPENDRIAGINAESPAKGSGDHHAAVFIDTGVSLFGAHDSVSVYVISLIHA